MIPTIRMQCVPAKI